MTPDPSTWGLTDAGFRRPSLAEIIETYVQAVEKQLRELNIEDWQVARDPTNPIYMLQTVNANMLDRAFACLEAIWNQMHPLTATGLPLQALGRIVGVTKFGQAVSLVRLTLTGTAGIVIPKGTRFKGPAGHLYALDAATTIGAGGTVVGLCSSVDYGNLPIVDPVRIVNPILGLDSASVAEAYSPGRLVETDPEFRLRILAADSRFVGGRTTENAIRAAIRAVPGVTAVDVISNRQDVPDSEGRPAHSAEVIIYPSIDETRIGPVLLFHQAAGLMEYVGTETWETVDDSGTPRTMRWNVATSVPMKVKITGLSVDSGSAIELQDAVKTAVGAYVNGLQVGEAVSYARLVGAIVSVAGVVDATLIEVAKDSGTLGTSGITMTYREKATIDTVVKVDFA